MIQSVFKEGECLKVGRALVAGKGQGQYFAGVVGPQAFQQEEVGLGPVGGVGAQHGVVQVLLALAEGGDGLAVFGGLVDQ